MKLIIEVEVPGKTVEDVQKFVVEENELVAQTRHLVDIDAVEVFIAMWTSDGKLDYTVTKAEMTDGGE